MQKEFKLVVWLVFFWIVLIQTSSAHRRAEIYKKSRTYYEDTETEINPNNRHHYKIRRKSRMSQNIKGSAALDNFPLIDGHIDLPWILVTFKRNQLKDFDFTKNLSCAPEFNCIYCRHTDLPKLRAGKVGGLFWAAYVSCKFQYKNAVSATLEQIDLIKRFVNKFSTDLEFVTTSDGIMKAFRNKKIGSLIGVEGGHSIESKLSILRIYYEVGVRYMTLTHMCSTPWADASPIDTESLRNLTDFGKKVVLEMNRLGMMVDLSHVSHNTMKDVLGVTKAPVIFSHSSAHAVNEHHRNVRDDILKLVKINKGVVMVNFYSKFVGTDNTTIETVIDHINHIVDICGTHCVGIGSDYNGVAQFPEGLEDTSKYPNLFDRLRELNPDRWTMANLERLAGRNLVRVFRAVEKVRDSLEHLSPIEDWIPPADLHAVDSEVLRQCNPIPTKNLNDTNPL